ncbi:MAG: hypothetical protein M3P34_09155 [Actinomycetota bacterium]|nr:hypothetical protein [Actinomycetota bacterium]
MEVELPGGGTFVYRILSVGFTHVDMEVDDLLVVYAGEIPAESDNENGGLNVAGDGGSPDVPISGVPDVHGRREPG